MKYLYILSLLIIPFSCTHAFEVISERTWSTGNIKGFVQGKRNSVTSSFKPASGGVGTYLMEQYAYYGIPKIIGATHKIGIYNPGGASNNDVNKIKVSLCFGDNCFNWEKIIRLETGQSYYDTIYSQIEIFPPPPGVYTIKAETHQVSYPSSHDVKTVNLVVMPFPYDS